MVVWPVSDMMRDALAGRRIALTGLAGRDAALAAAIAAHGGVPLECPLVAVEPAAPGAPLDQAVDELGRYDWILFTSATAVTVFADRLATRVGTNDGMSLPRIAAVGPATARAAADQLRAPDFTAGTHTSRAMARALAAAGVVGRLLFPAADIASPDLTEALRSAGAEVHQVTAYRTGPGSGAPALVSAIAAREADAVLLSSPSAARFLADALGQADLAITDDRVPPVVCIGPSTLAVARTLGFSIGAVAADHTRDGLLHAVTAWFAHSPEGHHETV